MLAAVATTQQLLPPGHPLLVRIARSCFKLIALTCICVAAAAATTQQLLPPGHPLLGAAAWSQYHLAVTVHRDEEASSVATRLDGYHPEAPAVSLDSFIDGERLLLAFSVVFPAAWLPFMLPIPRMLPRMLADRCLGWLCGTPSILQPHCSRTLFGLAARVHAAEGSQETQEW